MSLLKIDCLDKVYQNSTRTGKVHAVHQVSFEIAEGEFLGLVGESGCGKSTLAKIVMGLVPKDGGRIIFDGKELKLPYSRDIYKNMQMIFQLPRDSFDPRKTIGQCITEIQKNYEIEPEIRQKQAEDLIRKVGLTTEFLHRYSHELSGGECQRAAIARALVVSPKLLICDEITSALDVSVQAQIVELLQNLKNEMGISALFISHDLALVNGICDRVQVMYKGEIVESGNGNDLLASSQNSYTRELFSSIYDIDKYI